MDSKQCKFQGITRRPLFSNLPSVGSEKQAPKTLSTALFLGPNKVDCSHCNQYNSGQVPRCCAMLGFSATCGPEKTPRPAKHVFNLVLLKFAQNQIANWHFGAILEVKIHKHLHLTYCLHCLYIIKFICRYIHVFSSSLQTTYTQDTSCVLHCTFVIHAMSCISNKHVQHSSNHT